ncbi:hypothetical protein [Providencia rustigianii]|uniref:hypothetical protein n=1 Tax=Providencia rustigianii TaxID=158850 RepID=UPI0022439C4D|nr:hypothetical protein [Providencia rustigianii]
MARKKSKIRTLRQYLTDFKREPHRCTCCQAKLNRVSLMLDGVAIHKEDISHLSQQLNDEEWHTLQTTRLKVLCRFCRELHTPPLPVFFDLVGFQRYLLVDLSMKRGLRANDAKNHANSVSSLFILKLIGTAFTATSVVMVGLRDGSAWKKEIILR